LQLILREEKMALGRLRWPSLWSLVMVFVSVLNVIAAELNDFGQETYGVDVSFPMQHATVSENYATLPHNIDPEHNSVDQKYKDMPVQPLGNKQEFYSNFMQGCRDFNGKSGFACDSIERGRIAMALRQPQSMYVSDIIFVSEVL
jgi:hypothetical protein